MITATLAAADGAVEVSEVRHGLGIGPMPHEQEGTYTAPPALDGTPTLTTYDKTPGLSATITAMHGRLAPIGLLLGLQLRSTTGEMALKSLTEFGTTSTAKQLEAADSDKVPSMNFSQTGIAAKLGLGWALSSCLHLELVGIVGADWTTWDNIAGLGSGDLVAWQGTGYGYTLGGRFGAYWTDPETGWQFGVESEYTRTRSTIATSYSDVTITAEPVNAGMSLRAVLGHRF